LLLLDDPLKDNEEAHSETIRKALHEWFASVGYTRLIRGGAIVLIQTRWHEDDLAGRLLREQRGENWKVLSLPAIAEQDESFRKEGEVLWPERFPLAELERIRTAIGGRAWTALYQQRPAAAEGHLETFKLRHRDYSGLENPPILHRKEEWVAEGLPPCRALRAAKSASTYGSAKPTRRTSRTCPKTSLPPPLQLPETTGSKV
jgi:hypothetical protein